MKNYKSLFLVLFSTLLFISCTDVVDVDVQTAPTRLVIEASLDWEKGTQGNEQTIDLSASTEFFSSGNAPIITGAIIQVTDLNTGDTFDFVDQGNGSYYTDEFIPAVGHRYQLEVIYEDETYMAEETLFAVPDLTVVGQSKEDGFSEDDLAVNMTLIDPEEEGNSYFFKFWKRGDLLPDFEEFDDEFVNGNKVDWFYEIGEDDDTDEKEAFQPGDTVDISFYAISPAYLKYMRILINQIGGVGLFESIPVSVKGNCINLTNADNYAHGYFRVTQVVKTSYTFE